MIEENGHRWEGDGEHRCVFCSLKYRQYREFKASYEEAIKEGDDERRDNLIKFGVFCPGRIEIPTFPRPPKPKEKPPYPCILQLDFWDPEDGKWRMLLDYKFDDPAVAKRIQETVKQMMAEAGIKDRRET